MRNLLRELGYGLGALRRAPGSAAVAVLTLALGIGAATAVFSVVNAVLLRPLPFADQERLTAVWELAKKRQSGIVEISYPNYRDWRDQNRVFTQFAAVTASNSGLNLTGAGEPLQVTATPVSSNFFSTLGVKPLLGRTFAPGDDRLGARPVVVLSGRLWQEQFAGDPHIVGRQLKLDAQTYTVVGVMPDAFRYPPGAQLWVPLVPSLGAEASEQRNNLVLKGIGRMKPGVTLEQARTEMEAVAGRLEKQYMKFNEGFSSAVLPFAGELVGESHSTLLIAFAGGLFLLLIAVANESLLLLVRTLERGPDAAGGRGGLAEAVVLGLLGCVGGLLLATLGIRTLRAIAPESVLRIDEVSVDGPTFLFALAASVLAAAHSCAVLALAARKRERAPGHPLIRFLVLSEVALALMLLIGAGLTLQSMLRLRRVHPGFSQRSVLTARIQLPATTYPEAQQRQVFFERLRERAAALPGVVSAARVLSRPLDDSATWEIPIAKEGQGHEELEKNPLTNFQAVSPDYFRTLGVRLLKGRVFDARDTESSPLVAIVGKGLAERFWPGQDPVGKRVHRVLSDQILPWITIVGLVDDVNYHGWAQRTLDFYLPARQNPLADYGNSEDLVLLTRVDPLTLARPLRESVYALDPNQAVTSVVTLEGMVDRALAGPRFTLVVMAVLGALALYLAAVGIYGLLSYGVNRRWRETGASRREVLRTVVAEGLKLTAIGLALGIVAALVLTRFMADLLYGVSSLDPFTFISVPLFLGIVAFLATLVPAVRAAGGSSHSTTRSNE
jgi:putative ABC transport system permease protein